MLDGFFTNILTSLFGRASDKRERKQQARALSNLLRLELDFNTALIDTLRMEGAGQWTAGGAAVARSLQADVLNMVFLPEEANRMLRHSLAGLPMPAPADEGEAEAVVGDALRSLWVRVRAVQALGNLGTLPDGMKDIRLLQRLRNLRDTMRLVVGAMKADEARDD
jgi:hypothetical protein